MHVYRHMIYISKINKLIKKKHFLGCCDWRVNFRCRLFSYVVTYFHTRTILKKQTSVRFDYEQLTLESLNCYASSWSHWFWLVTPRQLNCNAEGICTRFQVEFISSPRKKTPKNTYHSFVCMIIYTKGDSPHFKYQLSPVICHATAFISNLWAVWDGW